MTNDHDFEIALDQALQLRAAGTSLEDCLARFPQYRTELAPLLQAADFTTTGLQAGEDIPTPNLVPGKQRFLRSARLLNATRQPARLRRQTPPSRLLLRSNFIRIAAAATLALIFFVAAGTGVSVAAGRALPGDALYPAKLALEQARLALTFNSQARSEYAGDLANRRRAEVQSLVDSDRQTTVAFDGILEAVGADTIVVSGLKVQTTDSATLQVGDYVLVEAETRSDRTIVASSVQPQTDRPSWAPTVPADTDIAPDATVRASVTDVPNDVESTTGANDRSTSEPSVVDEISPTPEPIRDAEPTSSDEIEATPEASRDAEPTRSDEVEPSATPASDIVRDDGGDQAATTTPARDDAADSRAATTTPTDND